MNGDLRVKSVLTRFLQLTAGAILSMLVLTMLWANLANDKLMTVFYFCPRK